MGQNIGEINVINIVPAKFVEKNVDGNIVLKCYLNEDNLLRRSFDPLMFKKFKEIEYVFIGIITGVGMIKINVVDANQYKSLFEEYWSVL